MQQQPPVTYLVVPAQRGVPGPVLHPVRLRIMHAMSGGRVLTTSDLGARLPDVPKTTVYRHVGLLADFNAYLDREHANPFADSVGYVQVPLWLSQGELAGLISEVRSALMSRMGNGPAPDRSLYLASPILFPIEERPHGRAGPPEDQGG